MELLAFSGLMLILGIVLLGRSRRGGTGAVKFGRQDQLDESPMVYGCSVMPPPRSTRR